MDADLYPFAYKATVSSSSRLETKISAWLKEHGLELDKDYEVHHFSSNPEVKGFDLLSSTFIFDSKAHAVLFKLTFGGDCLDEAD